ncbi:MAG: rod shape-determining protein MreC [Coriobacteriia bacterium]|nr:rod shape-determining protein MreC [Coriobacteriia bacterium]
MRVHETKEPRSAQLWLAAVMIVLSILCITVWDREGPNGPLHSIRSGVQALSTPLARVGNFLTSPIRQWTAEVNVGNISQEDARTLYRQNEELRQQVLVLEERLLQFQNLEKLMEAQQNADYNGVSARVIGIPANAWDQVITINKGSNADFEVSMPVVGPQGLLGQIIEVGPNFSKVRLTTDRRSGVACMLQRTRTPGIATGSLSGTLTLEFVANEVEVEPGDVVITSGLGGIYPEGLKVGEVLDAITGISSLYQTIRVTPSNDPRVVEEVMVLTNTTPFVETAEIGSL